MGFSAPQHLTYEEVLAYSEMMGRNLNPAKVRWIMMMDDLFMDAWATAHAPQPPKQMAQPPTQQTPMHKVLKPMGAS